MTRTPRGWGGGRFLRLLTLQVISACFGIKGFLYTMQGSTEWHSPLSSSALWWQNLSHKKRLWWGSASPQIFSLTVHTRQSDGRLVLHVTLLEQPYVLCQLYPWRHYLRGCVSGIEPASGYWKAAGSISPVCMLKCPFGRYWTQVRWSTPCTATAIRVWMY